MIIDFNQVLGYFAGLPAIVALLFVLALALALTFAGREMIKVLAFIVTGLIVGGVSSEIGMNYMGTVGAILGGVAGFLFGGILGVFLVIVGVGIALGYSPIP